LAYLTFPIYTVKKHNVLCTTPIILPSATWTIKKFPAKLFGARLHINAPDGGIKEIKPVGPLTVTIHLANAPSIIDIFPFIHLLNPMPQKTSFFR